MQHIGWGGALDNVSTPPISGLATASLCIGCYCRFKRRATGVTRLTPSFLNSMVHACFGIFLPVEGEIPGEAQSASNMRHWRDLGHLVDCRQTLLYYLHEGRIRFLAGFGAMKLS